MANKPFIQGVLLSASWCHSDMQIMAANKIVNNLLIEIDGDVNEIVTELDNIECSSNFKRWLKKKLTK